MYITLYCQCWSSASVSVYEVCSSIWQYCLNTSVSYVVRATISDFCGCICEVDSVVPVLMTV
jgi:hypothetical protein